MSHHPPKTLRINDALDDIRDALTWIDRHIGNISRDEFLADRKTLDSVVKNLVDIGEAANNIMQSDATIESSKPDLWNHLVGAYAMRIKLTHGYRSIDASVVWNTVKIHLPEFRQLISAALK